MTGRDDRFHKPEEDGSPRPPSARDRDRILHSSAWRRLGGVTQVVDPSEGHLFHNRLTHSLKVAQIGRRLAEILRSKPEEAKKAARHGGLDPEVVEAAALAHDLGHPPFGHVAEKELDKLITAEGDPDGYEGNAQSFRIVTRLAIRRETESGLNLTRATLNAILKYPNLRGTHGKKSKKWGAYRTEESEFAWAREQAVPDEGASLEAEIMDRSDDIAYAIHDLEDFYKAGLIPLDRLTTSKADREAFIKQSLERRHKRQPNEQISAEEWRNAADLLVYLPVTERYTGSSAQRAALRKATSYLINQYVSGIKINDIENRPAAGSRLLMPKGATTELSFLKELTWFYIIDNPKLATQQYGKAQVIRDLFKIFFDAVNDASMHNILPVRGRELLEAGEPATRVVADIVSSLSDQEALVLHRRLTGYSAGSVLDLISL